MNQIQEFRHNRLLSKEFDIKEATPCPSLASEIQPVVLVSDLTQDDPFAGPINDYWCGFSQSVLPAVGEFATFQLLNPPGSGVVVVIDTVGIAASTGEVGIYLNTAANTPTTTGQHFNRRGAPQATPQSSAAFVTAVSQAAALIGVTWTVRATGSLLEYQKLFDGITLDEGQNIQFQHTLVSVLFCLALRWREYPRRPGR